MPLADRDRLREIARTRIEDVVQLATRICEVPAPTGQEVERARFVASLWQERSYTPEIDAISNVYVRRGKRNTGPVVMLLAHIDTVFPAGTPIKVQRDGDILRGPGIGDNCVSVASMLTLLDILDAEGIETPVDIVAVANVGEEGLGNLRGARAAVERYHHELGAVIVIDGRYGHIVHAGVGSQRWRITVHGPGGHSYGNFGVPSAIHGLAKIITAISELQVPAEPKTTFNVGMIEGGTSVNTIAATASALLDMRSTNVDSLEQLVNQVRAIVEQPLAEGLRVEVEVLGERPAGALSLSDPLVQLAGETLTWLGVLPEYGASSTDANIPISQQISSVCVGITNGGRVHTVEEYLEIPPIGDGLAQVVRLTLDACEMLAKQG